MKAAFCEGFAPVFDENSRVLILGSFPSVKSRAQGFYYGNPQNAFWRTLGAFFHEEPPKDAEGRRAYVADVASLVKGSKIRRILCNGTTAYNLFQRHFPELVPIAKKLPSTSPANPRFCVEPWLEALSEAFSGTSGEEARAGAEEKI